MIQWLGVGSLPDVAALADSVYPPGLWEPVESFAWRLRLYPAGALGYFDEGRLLGYVFSHPWLDDEVAPLGVVEGELPNATSCYYLHDCAVLPDVRGLGYGRQLARAALHAGVLAGYRKFTLVAVGGTERYWGHLGFRRVRSVTYAPKVTGTFMRLELALHFKGGGACSSSSAGF